MEDGAEGNEAWHLGAMRARYLIDAGAWTEVGKFLPGAEGLDTSSVNFAFIEGLTAHYQGDGDALARSLAVLRGVEEGFESEEAAILALELKGLQQLKADPEAALAALERAVAAEAEMPYMFGPPAIVKPTAELLGEVLLGLGRSADAMEAFSTQLERTPGRASALLGLARAAKASGEPQLAREAYGRLVTVSQGASASPVWLDEARTGAIADPQDGGSR